MSDEPFCRDCADEDGICPHDGLPCNRDDARESPQRAWKCACPSWTTRRECMRSRYPDNELADDPEECGCACHETEDDNDHA